MNKHVLVVSGVIIATALTRLIPHPLNFAPIGAISLFGAAYITNRKFAFFVPIVAMFISDLLVNNIIYYSYYGSFTLFTPGFIWVYGSIACIVVLGMIILKKLTLTRIIGSSFLASISFFLISNFGVWLSDPDYPINSAGLLLCYEMALPFFKNTILGDLFYATIMFGGFEFALKKAPVLQKA